MPKLLSIAFENKAFERKQVDESSNDDWGFNAVLRFSGSKFCGHTFCGHTWAANALEKVEILGNRLVI